MHDSSKTRPREPTLSRSSSFPPINFPCLCAFDPASASLCCVYFARTSLFILLSSIYAFAPSSHSGLDFYPFRSCSPFLISLFQYHGRVHILISSLNRLSLYLVHYALLLSPCVTVLPRLLASASSSRKFQDCIFKNSECVVRFPRYLTREVAKLLESSSVWYPNLQ